MNIHVLCSRHKSCDISHSEALWTPLPDNTKVNLNFQFTFLIISDKQFSNREFNPSLFLVVFKLRNVDIRCYSFFLIESWTQSVYCHRLWMLAGSDEVRWTRGSWRTWPNIDPSLASRWNTLVPLCNAPVTCRRYTAVDGGRHIILINIDKKSYTEPLPTTIWFYKIKVACMHVFDNWNICQHIVVNSNKVWWCCAVIGRENIWTWMPIIPKIELISCKSLFASKLIEEIFWVFLSIGRPDTMKNLGRGTYYSYTLIGGFWFASSLYWIRF